MQSGSLVPGPVEGGWAPGPVEGGCAWGPLEGFPLQPSVHPYLLTNVASSFSCSSFNFSSIFFCSMILELAPTVAV